LKKAINEFLSSNPKQFIRNLREDIECGHTGEINGANKSDGTTSEEEEGTAQHSDTPASGYFS